MFLYITSTITSESIQLTTSTPMLLRTLSRLSSYIPKPPIPTTTRPFTYLRPHNMPQESYRAEQGTHASHTPIPKEDAWKHRPPYLIQPPEDFGPIKWRGKCHCGQIGYSLNRETPLKAKFCHCRGCQLMHGASTYAHSTI